MPIETTPFDEPQGAASIPGSVSETEPQLKDKVTDFGRAAVDKIDANRGTAASGLESAANALHQKAETLPGGEAVSRLAHSTADRLSSTAGYVREHDVNDMMADVKQVVKNNPGPSLLAAAAVGFLLGRAFTNDD